MAQKIAQLDVSLETDPREYDRLDEVNRLRVRARDASGDPFVDESYRCIPSVEFVAGPLFASGSILEGEEVTLFGGALDDWRLLQVPVDGQPALDVRERPSGERVDIASPMPVSPVVVVEAAIDFAAAALERYRERADGDVGQCWCLRLEVGIHEARSRLSYHREHGSQEGYDPTLDPDHLEWFVFDCRGNEQLVEFVLETDALDEFVRALCDRDDEYADEAYRQLLEYRDDICGHALRILAETADERATLHLENVCWSTNPELSPLALAALSETAPESTVEVATTLARPGSVWAEVVAVHLLDIGPNRFDEFRRAQIAAAFERTVQSVDEAPPALARVVDTFSP